MKELMTYDLFVSLHGEAAWYKANPQKFIGSADKSLRDRLAPQSHEAVMKWVRLIDPDATGILDLQSRLTPKV